MKTTTFAAVTLLLAGILLLPGHASAMSSPVPPANCGAQVQRDSDIPGVGYHCWTPPPCQYCYCAFEGVGIDLSAAGSEWDAVYGASCSAGTAGSVNPGTPDPNAPVCVGITTYGPLWATIGTILNTISLTVEGVSVPGCATPPPVCDLRDSPSTGADCAAGGPCGCMCPVVGAGIELQLARQDVDGHAVSVVPPACGFGAGGGYTPGAVDPYATDCVSAGGGGSPIILGMTGAPLCASPCAPLPAGGGIVGDAEGYGNTMTGIACNAAQGATAAADAAVADARAAVTAQVADARAYESELLGTAVPLSTAPVVDWATGQANAQADNACDYLLGTACNGGSAPATPACPVPVTGGDGVIGDTVNHGLAACGIANAGAPGAFDAALATVNPVAGAAGGLASETVAYANAAGDDAGASAGALSDDAGAAAAVATGAAGAACDATLEFAAGSSC